MENISHLYICEIPSEVNSPLTIYFQAPDSKVNNRNASTQAIFKLSHFAKNHKTSQLTNFLSNSSNLNTESNHAFSAEFFATKHFHPSHLQVPLKEPK